MRKHQEGPPESVKKRNKEAKRCAFASRRRSVRGMNRYAGTHAAVGHTPAQAAQSVHFSASML
jgi:hypothetical protein